MDMVGSTTVLELIRPGVILKEPFEFTAEELARKVDLCFAVEPLILQRLGEHPPIVK